MNQKLRILIADDKKAVLRSLEFLLEDCFDEVVTVSNPNRIPALIRQKLFDVYLLDMNFSAGINTGNEGIFWLNEIRKIHRDAQIVFITAYGEIELAVKAVKHGAFDFTLKPWDNTKLIETLLLACEQKKPEEKNGDQEFEHSNVLYSSPLIHGTSKAMEQVFDIVDKVAATDANILICGENGTGKEVIAREIHKLSLRANSLFLPIDISTLNENLVESELFGHVKNAFTGAETNRQGKFVEASGGTLFMDEIGNLSLNVQTKLLNVLQGRTITPLGTNKEVAVDIRVICATNSNITEMVKQGSFRKDLFYRVNTFTINLPALRNRKEDIVPLAVFYLNYFSKKYHKHDFSLSPKASDKLKNAPWPGNIRELKHLMERLVIMTEGEIIQANDLKISDNYTPASEELRPLNELEKDAIINALEYHKGNVTKVAKALNISRQTLYNKMKKHDL